MKGCGTSNHGFRDFHQIVVVGVGHVKLAGSELWIVSQVNALIPELATNFVDSVNTPNYQHLKLLKRLKTFQEISM